MIPWPLSEREKRERQFSLLLDEIHKNDQRPHEIYRDQLPDISDEDLSNRIESAKRQLRLTRGWRNVAVPAFLAFMAFAITGWELSNWRTALLCWSVLMLGRIVILLSIRLDRLERFVLDTLEHRTDMANKFNSSAPSKYDY